MVMEWQPSERMRFFLRHGSLIVSINSIVIALMSLWLTIDSARIDREYKEAMVLPHLDHVTRDFSVRLKNTGLGPAVIKRVLLNTASACYDSERDHSSAEVMRAYSDWATQLTERLLG